VLVVGAGAALAQNRLQDDGYVGIGTASPTVRLDVRQDTDTRLDGLRILNSSGDRSLFLWIDGSDIARLEAGRDGIGSLVINPGGGSVGIGTTNPIVQFDLQQNADSALGGARILNSAGERSLFLWVDGANVSRVDSGGGGSGPLALNSGGGRVGIGTTAPGAQLDVRQADDSTLGGLRILNSGNTRSFLLWVDGSNVSRVDSGGGGFGPLAINAGGGKVGIGTSSPNALLHVAGDAQVDGNIAARYQDIAEWVPAIGTLPHGTVVVIDGENSNRVRASSLPYDTRIAGVVSSRPGVLLGEAAEDRAKVAHSGRVKVKVDAQYGPVAVGDLLVSSPTAGHAMRSEPITIGGATLHRPGTLLGKALEPLQGGQGEILVLLTLQ
jgi:hypothetical protein